MRIIPTQNFSLSLDNYAYLVDVARNLGTEGKRGFMSGTLNQILDKTRATFSLQEWHESTHGIAPIAPSKRKTIPPAPAAATKKWKRIK